MRLLFVSAAVLLAVLAEAVNSLDLKGTRIRRALNKRKLMEKAVPVQKTNLGRQLNNDQKFELTGAYSLQFNKCISLPMEADEDSIMFNEDLMSYTKNGKIVTQKSYVLFNVCVTEMCSYYASDDNLYMVELESYMDAIVDFYIDRNDEYCSACEDAKEYCEHEKYVMSKSYDDGGDDSLTYDASAAYEEAGDYAGDNANVQNEAQEDANEEVEQNGNGYGYQQQDGYSSYNSNNNNGYWAQQQKQYQNAMNGEQQAEANNNQYNNQNNQYSNSYWGQQAKQYYQNGGGRQLQQSNGVQVIDCEQCEAWNCFDGAADDYQDLDNIGAWVQTVIGCGQTDTLFLDIYSTYAGFMCNQDGSGVDIAMFLDDECSIYTSALSFSSEIASEDDMIYMDEAKDMIQHTFLNPVDCNANVEYVTYDEYRYRMQNYYGHNGNNNNNKQEAVEFCQTLFKADAVLINDCYTFEKHYDQYQYNQVYQADEEDLEGENADQEEEDLENEDADQEDPEGQDAGQEEPEDQNNIEEGPEDQYVNQYYDETYPFYQWVLSQEDAQDSEAVCSIVGPLLGEYNFVYRWADSGQIYDYGTHLKTSSGANILNFFNQYRDSMSKPLIGAIAVAAAIALLAFLCTCWSCSDSSWSKLNLAWADQKQKHDEKSEHLVGSETGDLI